MGMWTLPSDTTTEHQFSEEEMSDFIETLAMKVVLRGMAMPAGFGLEMMKPVSFIGSQAFLVFAPFLEMLVEATHVEKLHCLFGRIKHVEHLKQRIEALANPGNQDDSK